MRTATCLNDAKRQRLFIVEEEEDGNSKLCCVTTQHLHILLQNEPCYKRNYITLLLNKLSYNKSGDDISKAQGDKTKNLLLLVSTVHEDGNLKYKTEITRPIASL